MAFSACQLAVSKDLLLPTTTFATAKKSDEVTAKETKITAVVYCTPARENTLVSLLRA